MRMASGIVSHMTNVSLKLLLNAEVVYVLNRNKASDEL